MSNRQARRNFRRVNPYAAVEAEGRPITRTLRNGLVVVYSPGGHTNNLANRQYAAQWLRSWRERNRVQQEA